MYDMNNQFIWFTGTVLRIDDPDQIGRIKVRANPFYDDIDEEFLPWAMCIQPIYSAAVSSIGISPTGIEVGSSVFGFFLDGLTAKQPVILGTWAGIGDVTTLATGTNPIPRVQAPIEPGSSYGAVYPNNKVVTTKGGHAVEIDDTPGKERIHVFHKSGSYVEMRPDGSVIFKTDGDRYDVTVGSNRFFVQDDVQGFINGSARIQIEGDTTVLTQGKTTVSSAQQILIASPLIEINGEAISFDNAEAQEQEAFDMGDSMPAISVQEFTTRISSDPNVELVNTLTEAKEPANDVQITPVQCGNYNATDSVIKSLTTEVALTGSRYTIPSSKHWKGQTLTDEQIVCNLGALHENVIKPLFNQFGEDKFFINSGFRSGTGPSQHDAGMAADIQIRPGTNLAANRTYLRGDAQQTIEYLKWMRDNVPFDQLAIEYSKNFFPQCWIHVSFVRPEFGSNRKQIFTWQSGSTPLTVVRGDFALLRNRG